MEIEEIVKIVIFVIMLVIGVSAVGYFFGGDLFSGIKSAMRLGG
jgi:hypothetical protein